MSCFIRERSNGKFGLLEMGNSLIQVTLSPMEGGKIRHLVNAATGRDYCWQMPNSLQNDRRPGLAYGDADCSGIDECLPTIAPCRWNNRELPDHGEVWTAEARITDRVVRENSVEIATTTDIPISQMCFERRMAVKVNQPLLDLSYRLTNTAAEDQDFLWALHPLISFLPNETVVLPGVKEVVTDEVKSSLIGGFGRRFPWPVPVDGVDLSKLDVGPVGGGCGKFFTAQRISPGWAALHNPRRGDLLAFLFDPAIMPYVGIWINRGGWGGYEHMAIEPTNGYPDALSLAAGKWKTAGRIKSGESLSWVVRILCDRHMGVINQITKDGIVL